MRPGEKRNTHHGRIALFLIIAICALSFPSFAVADVAFTTGAGELGIVAASRSGGYAVTERAKTFAPGARIFGYNEGKRLLVAEARTGADDRVRIFDTADLSAPLTDTSWDNARGIRDAVYLRGYLYVVCHDSSNVVKIDTNDHTRKEIEWIYPHRGVVPALPAGHSARGTAVVRFGNEIYALFRIVDGNDNYAPSVLVNLADDITTLRTLGYVSLPPNTGDLEVLGDHIYAVCPGAGAANAPAQSTIQRVDPEAMTASGVLRGDEIEREGGRIVGLAFDGGKRAVVTTRKEGGTAAETKFWLLADLDASSAVCLRTTSAPQASVCYDARTKRFCISDFAEGGGGTLHAYDTSGTATAMDAETLGGTPRYLAAVRNTPGSDGENPGGEDPGEPGTDSGSGGGGCTAGASAFLAAVLIASAGRRSRSRRR